MTDYAQYPEWYKNVVVMRRQKGNNSTPKSIHMPQKKKVEQKVTIEIYNRGNGFNFRLVVEDNLGANAIASTRQGYSKLAECKNIASKITYAGIKPEIKVLKAYYRMKK